MSADSGVEKSDGPGGASTPSSRPPEDSSSTDGVSTRCDASPKAPSMQDDDVHRASLDSARSGELNQLSLRAVDPVEIAVDKLSVDIDLAPGPLDHLLLALSFGKGRDRLRPVSKTILEGVDARMPAGSLTAILGSSGSGKTTMLNVLSERVRDRRLAVRGDVTFNGSAKLSSVRSAYVMQQDVLLPTLTVRETLGYAADLRLPPPATREERRAVVEEVVLELGLKECANTRIGSHENRGCSGGEKRRTSLGVQLLANPSVLFLDEVTTGLDAASAYQLVRTLKQLARKGRTVVMTIHQPRSEIWGLFDSIILLTGGRPAYSGPADRCLPYFEGLGHPFPAFVNPAEYLVDLVAVDTRAPELEAASSSRAGAIRDAWASASKVRFAAPAEKLPVTPNAVPRNGQVSFARQVRVQTARSFKTTLRDPMGILGLVLEATSMAAITGWIFYGLDGSLAGIRSREGALYTVVGLQGYLILLFEIYRLTLDVPLFDRERVEGVVSVASYLTSRRLSKMVEDVSVPALFSVIFYFMVNLRRTPTQFFTFFAIVLLNQYVAVSFATLCVALFRDFAGASLIANLNFTLQSMCSGFFVTSGQIPPWVRWLKYTAYVWYANGAANSNEFVGGTSDPRGNLYDCPYPGGIDNPACTQWTGSFVIASQQYPPKDWISRPIIVLAAYVVTSYLGAAVALRFNVIDVRMSKARASTIDKSLGKEKLEARSTQEVRTVAVSLHGYSLRLNKRDALGRQTLDLTILQPVNATFEPGVLNVIMGPSGSGKTSLLNIMAGRLHNSLLTRYSQEGTMLYGGSLPTRDVIRSVAAYVSQDDDALLPTLTVRETLHYAAELRLPSWMGRDEKKRRAESVLIKLGLRDCADNLIGSDLAKGISGGEKRRVSIAVQVLTDPRILLLDEPTSGLDSFTATSIMDVLRGLAEEGRTLILTIHQARSDLFTHFGNILLLARGGAPVYAGRASSMIHHFSALGHDCPRTTNPADFALDLITIDLQQAAREVRSRRKVQSLVTNWRENRASVAPHRASSQISAPAELGSLRRTTAPFRISFPLLVRRSWTSFRRSPNAVLARTTQVVGFGAIVTLFFAPLHSDFESVQSRLGFIQEVLALYFVGMLQNVAVYPAEQRVFYREHDDAAYGVEAFFLQYTVLELPFEVASSLAFGALAVFAAGLPRTAEFYAIMCFNAFCIVSCGESLGIAFNTLFPRNTGFAVNLVSVLLSTALLMAGVMSIHLHPVLRAVNCLSPGKWSIGNLAPYSLAGVTFTCAPSQRLPDGRCAIADAADVLSLYQIHSDPALNVLALGVCTAVYRLVAYLILRAKRSHWDWGDRAANGGAK